MYEAFEDRLAVNEPVLSKVLDCRREIAKLLGYQTWADYATEIKMVKTAKGVEQVRPWFLIPAFQCVPNICA